MFKHWLAKLVWFCEDKTQQIQKIECELNSLGQDKASKLVGEVSFGALSRAEITKLKDLCFRVETSQYGDEQSKLDLITDLYEVQPFVTPVCLRLCFFADQNQICDCLAGISLDISGSYEDAQHTNTFTELKIPHKRKRNIIKSQHGIKPVLDMIRWIKQQATSQHEWRTELLRKSSNA